MPITTGLFDLRFSVNAVASCGNRCKLASSSSTNHTRCFAGLSGFISRRTRRSSHKLMSGCSGALSSGVLVTKIQPCFFFAHSRAVHLDLACASVFSKLSESAIRLSDARTPSRCAGADWLTSDASSVPCTSRSSAAPSRIISSICWAVIRYRSICANIFSRRSREEVRLVRTIRERALGHRPCLRFRARFLLRPASTANARRADSESRPHARAGKTASRTPAPDRTRWPCPRSGPVDRASAG